jgi:uncharacterized protein
MAAKPSIMDVHYYTTAARLGKSGDILEFLNRFPQHINVPNSDGHTALMLAAAFGNAAIARLLVEKGADIHAKHARTHWTALTNAAANNRPDILSLLLQRGAAWDETDAAGKTPLVYTRERRASAAEAVLLQWAEKKALEAEIAAFSPALTRPIPAPKPLRAGRRL